MTELIEIQEVITYLQDNMTMNTEDKYATINVEPMIQWLINQQVKQREAEET